MAIYYSDHVLLNANGVNTVEPRYGVTFSTEVIATATFASAVTLTAGDIINMLDVPLGVFVRGVTVDSDALDSGSSLTLNLGDSLVANRYMSAITNSRAGGYQTQNTAGVMGTLIIAGMTRVFFTVGASAAGALTPTKGLRVGFSYISAR